VGNSVTLEGMAEMLRSVLDQILQSKVDVTIAIKERTANGGPTSHSEREYVSIQAGCLHRGLVGHEGSPRSAGRPTGREQCRIARATSVSDSQIRPGQDRGTARPQIRRLYRRKVRSRFFGEI
jgi:hypothetical protein